MATINYTSIYTANLLGVMLGLVLLIGNGWRWKRNDRENSLFIFMLILVICTCISEPIAFINDGMPGLSHRIIIYICDTLTFASNLMASCTWLVFLVYHLKGTISRIHIALVNSIVALGLLTLLINLFHPVVFMIDETNTYHRFSTYYIYLAADVLMLLDSFATYLYIRLKGRRLRFFFFWVYSIPVLLGAVIQSRFYGTSMIAPCMMISLAGLMSTIQNEMIFKDKLTGIYNRYYLDQLDEELKRDKDGEYTFIMIDINDFKSINDNYGHQTGDQAIIDTANILKKAVGSQGAAIRYAGDEFVIVLSTRSEIDTDIFITHIKKGFDDFNKAGNTKYELNVSMGYDVVNLRKTSMDEVMNHIDKLMYEDKTRYYKTHEQKNRRNKNEEDQHG